jgi:2-oxoglutarate dehydrogenase E1 component
MIEAPVLHVNGDDPEAWCWRPSWRWSTAWSSQGRGGRHRLLPQAGPQRAGHASLTQPLMYKKIASTPGTRKLYADKLAGAGPGRDAGRRHGQGYRAAMDAGKHTVDPVLTNFKSKYAVDWSPLPHKKWTDNADTAIPMAEWKRWPNASPTVPRDLHAHRWVKKVLDDRAPWAAAK